MALLKMLILISLLILVHELGHFLVARAFKIKVSRFGFGLPFGPTAWEKEIGGIKVCVHWLLFGGYVAFPDDEKECDLPQNSPELFKNKPIYQRACVISAGVVANLIMAYVLVLFCCLHWGKLPMGEYNVTIDKISDKASASTLASGIEEGDKLIAINGKEVIYPHELMIVAEKSAKFNNVISPEQHQKVLNKFLELNKDLNEGSILEPGTVVSLPASIEEEKVILTDEDVYMLKSKVKYIKLSENQQKYRNEAFGKDSYTIKEPILLSDFAAAIADTYSPVELTVEREGNVITLPYVYTNDEGLLGLAPGGSEKVAKIDSLGKALVETQKYMARQTKLMFWSLKLLVTGQVPMDKMTSIVAVTKIGSDIIEKAGMLKGLLLTAIISLNLAILNIMPVPALDGGHLMFLMIEKIKGKPVDEKVIENFSNVFFYILIALMIIFVGNDLWSIFVKKLY